MSESVARNTGTYTGSSSRSSFNCVARGQEHIACSCRRVSAWVFGTPGRVRKPLRDAAAATSRPGLLQEARIRWVQTEHAADALYGRILHILGSGKHVAEEKLRQIFEILTGGAEWTKAKGQENIEWGKYKAGEAGDYASAQAGAARNAAGAKAGEAKEAARNAGKSGAGKVEDAARNVKSEL